MKKIKFHPKINMKKYFSYFFIASVFALPLSSTGKSIFIILGLIFLLVHFNIGLIKQFCLQNNWAIYGIILFIITILFCIHSPANTHERLLVIEKFIKLALLPLFVIGFSWKKNADYALLAFLIAMAITCALSILSFYQITDFFHFYLNPDKIFRNHIITGIMIDFASYLCLFYFSTTKSSLRFIYILLLILFSYQILFITSGRTGYILFFLILSVGILQFFRRQISLIIFASFTILFLISIPYNCNFQKLKNYTQYELKMINDASLENSIGYRLRFQAYAFKLFKNHPLIGNGTGSFTHNFELDKPVPSWSRRLLEPHSQYWFVATEFGMVGLILFGLFYFSLVHAALTLNKFKPLAVSLLLMYFIGNFSDSLLFYSGSGYFFILLMAIFLSEKYKFVLTNNYDLNHE